MESNEILSSEIRVVYKTPQFEAFYNSLPTKVQTKFEYVIDVVTTIYDVPTKFVKHLHDTDLYEMRVPVATSIALFSLQLTNPMSLRPQGLSC